MSHKYAVISDDEQSVVEFRSYPEPLAADQIKKLPNGRFKVRPVVMNFAPVPEFHTEQIIDTIEAERVVRSNIVTPKTGDALLAVKSQVKRDIDNAADTQRQKYVSPGLYTQQEYLQAETEATAWLDNQQLPCPLSVTSWATAKGWTNLQAAQDITTTAAQFRSLLNAIRSTRLIGKASVDAAADASAVSAALASVRTQLAALP